jgi:cytochrome c oxidase subunit 3
MAHGEVHHDYHLVDPSPWPIVGAAGAGLMLIGAVFWMNSGYTGSGDCSVNGQPWIFLIGFRPHPLHHGRLVAGRGAGSIVRERPHAGGEVGLRWHDPLHRLRSDVFFAGSGRFQFRAVFLADVSIGQWPPQGIVTFDPWHLPLLNTLILLTSGATVTWAHHEILNKNRKGAIQGLIITVLLGMSFTAVQAYEYSHAAFTFGLNHAQLVPFTDEAHKSLTAGMGNLNAIYGSAFFMATGFHGLHVIIGTIFLIVCLGRAIAGHFTPTRHFGFEAAAWYWHFVDVVWLFLFAWIYVWGASAIVE